MMNEEYEFFWHGPFSQWAKSPIKEDNINFTCCEQYMMYHKALVFKDIEIAQRILEEKYPALMKTLGRKVKNFNEEVWDKEKENIVYKANYLKYSQNKDYRDKLFATGNKILVEASPVDKIWGIGLSEKIAASTPADKWLGQNLLGKIITKVKNDLKKEMNQ